MTRPRRREWPPLLSPGYLAFYAIGGAAWLALIELWDGVIAIGLFSFGLLLFAAALGGLSGYPRTDRKDNYGE